MTSNNPPTLRTHIKHKAIDKVWSGSGTAFCLTSAEIPALARKGSATISPIDTNWLVIKSIFSNFT